MSHPIISKSVSEIDVEGWRALPPDHGPSVSFVGIALPVTPRPKGSVQPPRAPTNESDAW